MEWSWLKAFAFVRFASTISCANIDNKDSDKRRKIQQIVMMIKMIIVMRMRMVVMMMRNGHDDHENDDDDDDDYDNERALDIHEVFIRRTLYASIVTYRQPSV